MRKIKIFIFGAICFLGCFLMNISAETKCDINNDGKLNDKDSEVLREMIVDDSLIPKKGTAEFERIDCNGDGKITLQDLVSTKKKENKVNCGNITNIPSKIPELTSWAITMIQIAVPVILVIMGSLDLFKGVTAQKEDEIKKGQQTFVKRLVVAVLIFFVIAIVKLVVSIVANGSDTNIVECIDCFLSDKCK